LCEKKNNDLATEDLLDRKCLHFESIVDKDVCTVSSFISFFPAVFKVFLFFPPFNPFLVLRHYTKLKVVLLPTLSFMSCVLGVLTICSFDLIVIVLYTFVIKTSFWVTQAYYHLPFTSQLKTGLFLNSANTTVTVSV
jgi:hypothetical protein